MVAAWHPYNWLKLCIKSAGAHSHWMWYLIGFSRAYDHRLRCDSITYFERLLRIVCYVGCSVCQSKRWFICLIIWHRRKSSYSPNVSVSVCIIYDFFRSSVCVLLSLFRTLSSYLFLCFVTDRSTRLTQNK